MLPRDGLQRRAGGVSPLIKSSGGSRPPLAIPHSTEGSAMTRFDSPRRHLLLPWTVQEREDPVLEFDHGDGVTFYDRHGRPYLDFLSQLFHANLGHGNRRVIEAIQHQAERTCCVSPQLLTAERAALAEALT